MTNKTDQFKSVYNQSKDKVYRLCLGFVGNQTDADNLFQEVFMKIWNNLETFRGETHINTWVYKIASNTALLYVSKRRQLHQKKKNVKAEDLIAHTIVEPPGDPDLKFKQLFTEISKLKEQDRIIISLLFEYCTYNEIAEVVGVSTSNVGVRINRIKKKLIKRLNTNG